MTPIYGKLSDIYGRGRVLISAIVLFVAASVLCAVAHSLAQLVLARALQGIGGGGLIVVAQAMVADFISPRERGRYQAYIASTWAFAGIAGPPLGGLFADHLSWRWIFWINLPLGALALVLCRRAAAKLALPTWARIEIDYAGAALLIPGVSALLIWTSQVQSPAGGAIPLAFALVAGVGLLVAFGFHEMRAKDPLIPPRLFAHRLILFTNAIGFAIATVQFAGLVLLPVFFQIVGGMAAADSGLMLMPMLFGIPVASFTAGQIMGRTGRYKAIIPCALALVTIAFGLFATMTAATPLPAIVCYVALSGLGLGACFPVLTIATQNAAAARDVGAATSSVTFSRSLGGSFGTAVFWSVLIASVAGASRGSVQTLFAYGRSGLERLPPGQRDVLLASLTQGFREVFLGAAAVALATFVFALFLVEEPLKSAPRTGLAARESRTP